MSLTIKSKDDDLRKEEERIYPVILAALGLMVAGILAADIRALTTDAFWEGMSEQMQGRLIHSFKMVGVAGAMAIANSWDRPSFERRTRSFWPKYVAAFLGLAGAYSIIRTTRERIDQLGREAAVNWIQSIERARNIAITESTRLYSWGAIEQLHIEKEHNKRWRTAEDDSVCEICFPMNGVVVGIDEDFTLPTGERVPGPPAHGGCRCQLERV